MIESSHEKSMTAGALYEAHRGRVNVGTDRLFSGLMLLQFIAGVVIAICMSRAANGAGASFADPHIRVALGLGALISFPPIALALFLPGRVVTRYAISICQGLTSALLIHLSGGRFETHLHIFGSLACLTFYRDWKLLVPTTLLTIILYYLLGGTLLPAVTGSDIEGHWHWVEQVGWMLFEDVFLAGSCIAMAAEMRNTAARTAEAFRKHCELEAVRDTALDCVISMDQRGRIVDFNKAAGQTFGFSQQQAIGQELSDLIIPERLRDVHRQGLARYLSTGEGPASNTRIEVPAMRANGSEFPVELTITAVQLDGPPVFIAYLRDIADRKLSDQQAKHAQMLALVASRTDNAVIITDPLGQIEWANEGFTRVTGYDLAEVVGKKPGSFLQGPETDQETVSRIRGHLERGEGFTAEILNYAKSGGKYWLAMEVQPVRDADGSLRHFMAIESDITARKDIEEQLRMSRERFDLAVRGSSDGLWEWTVATGEVYFSPSYHAQIGCEVGELPPELSTFKTRVHPEDLPRVERAIADVHAQRNPIFRVEFRFRHKQGHYIWILARAVALYSEHGQPMRMAGSHTDITIQRHAAEALQKAEEKFRGLFENSVLGIFQSTREGHYISANPAMARIYGYDSPEHLVSGLIDIGRQHYIDPARRSELVAKLDREGTVTGFEAEIRRTDGSHRWISKRARVVRESDGTPLYYEGTVEDITEAKAAAAALQLAKEEAEEARAAAEAANIAKSQFLANMSHEIRTPLNGVIGMAELMIRKGGLTDQQNRYANIIKSSADSLLSLISDILDFSKIEAGKMELSPVEYDVRTAIEDVVEMLSPKAEAKNLALACNISRAVPERLIGDPDRIRQNLTNLVNNAIKFTESGKVLIKADVHSQGQTHTVVKFTVQDTGVGIAPNRLDRLFKSFSQIDASTTRRYGGTGLGLAIVKQMAALMGGEVGVESVEGAGSSFWFTARLGVTAHPANAPANRSDLIAAIKGLKLLVVDEHEVYRQTIPEQLGMWDVSVDTCSTADSAMEKMTAAVGDGNPYRLVLIGLSASQGKMVDFLRQAKANPAFATTVFVAMTAMDSQIGESIVAELKLPPSLTKPIRHSTLFDTLADVSLCKLSAAPHVSAVPADTIGKLRAHVLLAEDNEVNQEVASGIIVDAGCTVEIVNNGAAAVAACTDPGKRFDLVLMDCQMPLMDGFEATRRIRAERGQELPIIALTANAVAGDRERCIEAGMTDYVPKPIDPDVLVETIRRLLQSRTLRRSTTPLSQPPSEAAATLLTPAAAQAPIDGLALLRRCRGKTDLAQRLLQLFADSVEGQLAELRSALASSQWEVFTRLAHTIKGASANLAANSVSNIASELERVGKTSDLVAAEAALAQLRREVQQCVAFIPIALTTHGDARSPAEMQRLDHDR